MYDRIIKCTEIKRYYINFSLLHLVTGSTPGKEAVETVAQTTPTQQTESSAEFTTSAVDRGKLLNECMIVKAGR